jgi:hypothetical protein
MLSVCKDRGEKITRVTLSRGDYFLHIVIYSSTKISFSAVYLFKFPSKDSQDTVESTARDPIRGVLKEVRLQREGAASFRLSKLLSFPTTQKADIVQLLAIFLHSITSSYDRPWL